MKVAKIEVAKIVKIENSSVVKLPKCSANMYTCIMYRQVHYHLHISLLYIHNTFKRAPIDYEYLPEPQKLTSVSSFVQFFELSQICRQEDVKMLLCKFLFLYLYFHIINLHLNLTKFSSW